MDSSFKNEQDEAVQDDDGRVVMEESESVIGVEEVATNGDEIVTALILNGFEEEVVVIFS